jgi:uncharacterized membrane protein YqjE
MNGVAFLFDIAPSGGSTLIAGAAAVAIFFLLIGVAAVAFFALRKTLKMAFRLAIVAVILVIALAGSVSLLYFSSGSSSPQRTRPPGNARR